MIALRVHVMERRGDEDADGFPGAGHGRPLIPTNLRCCWVLIVKGRVDKAKTKMIPPHPGSHRAAPREVTAISADRWECFNHSRHSGTSPSSTFTQSESREARMPSLIRSLWVCASPCRLQHFVAQSLCENGAWNLDF